MTKEDNEDFENSIKCWICDNDYIDTNVKVRDHCRITEKYRGSVRRDCNINVRLKNKIPVVFHNLKNYDSHLVMQGLGIFNLKINVIPNVLEKYMSFSISDKLIFIDSFQFLSSWLESLVKNLGKNHFEYLSREFDNNVLLDLVKQKAFNPYEYMTDFKKFKEQLPSKEKFYSSLTVKKLSEKEYDHVVKVLTMKAIQDYHDFCYECDVLLLADVFEKFRNNCIKNYRLCPSYYLSPPALSWDAMLNMTKVKLKPISDPHMYIFFEKGMRGGVSHISNRYSKANNRYLKFYDPKQEPKLII